MDEHLKKAARAIQERLEAQFFEFRGDVNLIVGPENIV
jgi:hypothetical protein